MIRRTKIGNFRASWVLRHRWEEGADSMITNYTANEIRKNLQLGIFAKRYQVVGPVMKRVTREETIVETFNGDNLVNTYQVGLRLIVCTVWVDFSFRPTMKIKVDNP